MAKEVELTTNFDDILHDTEIKIVVELMGGLHPAKEYISDALNAGKNVVTDGYFWFRTYCLSC